MTRKEQEITQLYLNTALEVAKDENNWLNFLQRASYNYKYRFDEQILIYAQKPEATAVAETTVWNKKMKRWINKGSKGIALMKDNKGEIGLRFVFDVSDTNSNVYGKGFKLWSAEEKYHNEIMEALEDKFGTSIDKSNLPFAIISTAFNYVADNIEDYFEELKEVIGSTELAVLSENKQKEKFLYLLMYSTVAVTMVRCNINPMEHLKKSVFSDIALFNTIDTISILGTATRDFSREILLEISRTVINVQKLEKNQNHTFERELKKEYDVSIEREKGSVADEYNLHNERGLSNTRYSSTRKEIRESGSRQIRINEVKSLENEQERDLHDTSNEQQIERTLDRNRPNSEKENTTNSGRDEETRENNGGIENTRPDGMGRSNEQYPSNSRTDSSKGDNLHLEKQNIEKEAEDASFLNAEDYNFNAGDIIYIGVKEFTILTIENEKITIYDNEFPLYQGTTDIKDIITRIAENPMNDYLKEERQQEEIEVNDISFNKWLDTFIEEKGIDLDETFEIVENNNTHIFEIGNVIENIKIAPPSEQAQIKDMIVKIDFYNGDVIDYFKHLAKALAKNYEQEFNQTEQQKEHYEDAVNNEVAKRITNKSRNRNIEYFDLHPDVPIEDRNNFKIKNDDLGVGTAKEKFKNNIEAIKVLKLCEEQNRYATKEEQEILSKYVGWGGLKSAFDEDNDNWSNEYHELKDILTDEEYVNAKESSLTAYYTPPIIIRNIYKALQNMGLKQANILEPSCRSR